MRHEITVPRMGESISEATIGQTLKPSGSSVKAEEEILELETDKVNQVLYAPAAGVLTLTVKPGEVVKIGQVIGFVEASAPASGSTPTPKSTPKPEQSAKPPEPTPAAPSPSRVRETKEQYLADLAKPVQVQPTAPPMEAKAEVPPTPSAPAAQPVQPTAPHVEDRETRRKMSRVRRVIAERLVEVQRTTAMLTTFNEVDMSQVIELRSRYKEAFTKRYGAKLGFMPFFVAAVVSALKVYPDLNSYIDGEDIVHREYYDLGIAVGTDKGLFVPVVKECDRLTFGQIEQAIALLAKKARDGTLQVDDLTGGGFTITNGGVYGSLLSTPILNPPQSGILGMHAIQERPVAMDSCVVIRPMMYLALSYDHRIVDGKQAVGFLMHIKECLEDPSRLLIEI